jgi:hypothetical protein
MNGDERAVVMERGDNGNEAVVLIWANIVRKIKRYHMRGKRNDITLNDTSP